MGLVGRCGIGGMRLAYEAATADDRARFRAYEEDELWRCSIDKLPDAAFDGADLWLMSPPCQPFTRTGHRRDVLDPRCRALLRLVDALPHLEAPPKVRPKRAGGPLEDTK
eukprot:Skav231225  [mRNA]  locus=scaffold813:188111:190842:+ [translate_table: standard]